MLDWPPQGQRAPKALPGRPVRRILTGMEIRRIGPDDDFVAGVVALGEAMVAADSPWAHPADLTRLRGMLRHGWDGEPPVYGVGLVGDQVVGGATMWASTRDNLTSAWLDLGVHPEHRRRGYGSDLVAWLGHQALARGRTTVGFESWDSSALHAFAAAHGFEQKSVIVGRRMLLADTPPDLAEQVRATQDGPAAAYEVVVVPVPAPEELIEDLAAVFGDINDAPHDDIEIEEEVFEPERVRGYEQAQLGMGQRLHQLVARHRETGVLAGHTIVAVYRTRPQIGDQHNTVVRGGHRGHRLGWLLKAAMLLHLAEVEPQLVSLDTSNAETNRHMIAVNEELGYRVTGRQPVFQKHLS